MADRFKLSSIVEPQFIVDISDNPDDALKYDPFKVQIAVEKCQAVPLKPGESQTEHFIEAIKGGFNPPLPAMSSNGYVSVWSALQTFSQEIDSLKNLAGLAAQNSSPAASNPQK